ncbi:MAG: TIGR03084 family protein [Dehalococcoidia bacterium]|nr:MAG: TIGR03084 family protein [Dehalococcoidia bacterium]
MKEIVGDLRAEQESLDAFLSTLKDSQWDLPTPAIPWTVKDSVSHIAYIDDVAVATCKGDNSYFELAFKVGMTFNEVGVEKGRSMKPSEVLAWWRKSRETMYDDLLKTDPKARLPWFSLPMGARAFATARIMETWAHGMDCYDAVGAKPVFTDRLRHVAYMACQARPFAYQVHGLPVPADPIRVEIILPSGAVWTNGPEGVDNVIQGDAAEFCQVAVQRRNVKDTKLQIKGTEAQRFMEVAQTYAGPAGPGRQPLK